MKRALKIVLIALCLFVAAASSSSAAEGGLLDLFAPEGSDETSGEDTAAKPEKKLRKGFRFRPCGMGQIRFISVENDKYVKESGDTSYADLISIERVWLIGQMDELQGFPKWQIRLVYDLTAENGSLVDFWARYKHKENEKSKILFDVGQMRLPFGWQMQTSPDKLITPNFSQVSRALFGDFIDQGARVCGGAFSDVVYSIGVFNGDWDPGMAVIAGFGWVPHIKKEKSIETERISFWLNYYYSRYEISGGSPLFDRRGTKTRLGFDFRVRLENLVFQGEFVTNAGSTEPEKGGTEPETSGGFMELGWYMLEKSFLPAIRYDVLDVDGDPFGARTNISVGFTYHTTAKEYITFQIFYEIHLEAEKQPNAGDGSTLHNDAFIVQLNVKF